MNCCFSVTHWDSHITIFKKRKIYFLKVQILLLPLFLPLLHKVWICEREDNSNNNIQHYHEWDGKVCSVTWIVSAIHQLKSSPSAFFKSGRSAERIANRQLILMIEFEPSLYSVSHSFSQRELSHPYWLEMNYLNYCSPPPPLLVLHADLTIFIFLNLNSE